MKMKVAAVLAATFALGATVAFAANPFSDVPSDSWAYQSVSQLAQAGIVNGYPDGTFKGQNDITRYEMAQMVAKAMAHQDKATAEQRAMINKLADEFADELDSLGVRVTNLENKVGNVKVTGDFRVRYQQQDGSFTKVNSGSIKDSKFDMRARIAFNAKIADDTIAQVRVTTNNVQFGNSTGTDGKDDLQLDRAFVTHNFGKNVSVTAGRYDQQIGATGYWYWDHVDGAAVTVGNDKLKLTGGYASFLEMNGISGYMAHPDNTIGSVSYGDPEVGYALLSGKIGKNVTLMGMYLNPNLSLSGGTASLSPGGSVDVPADVSAMFGSVDKVYGFGTNINLGQKFVLQADYLKTSFDKSVLDDADFLTVKLQYGAAQVNKVGTWDLFVDYVNSDMGGYLGGTGWYRSSSLLNNVKSYGVGADYVLAKGLTLTAFQTFSSSVKDSYDNTFKDPEEYTRVQVSYAF